MRFRFRLVDLLIIIVVVSIGCAILFSYLQHLREKARLADCENRIRQFAIASHTYHDSYKRLPPGTLGHSNAVDFHTEWIVSSSEFYWARAQQTSFLALVFPFNEMNSLYTSWGTEAHNLYKFLDEFDSMYSWFGSVPGSATQAFAKIEHPLCPSDNINEAYVAVTGATQPVTTGNKNSDAFGLLYWPDKDYSMNFGRTNFLGCAGAFSGGRHPDKKLRPYVGPMSSRNRITLETIADGTSNTLMLGETLGEIDGGQRMRAQSWCWGGLARGRGDIPWNQSRAQADLNDKFGRPIRMLGNRRNASVVGFAASHKKGVSFANADCSTVTLRRDIDWQLFYSLCGIDDGK